MEDKIRIDLLLYHETFVADTVLFERLEKVAKIALKICGVEIGAANIVLTDDNVIQDLNKSHRGLDEVTDVLSFSNVYIGQYYGDDSKVFRDIDDDDFVLPLGEAKVERDGTDVTIVAYSIMVGHSIDAAIKLEKEEGIKAEVINLRTLRPLDVNTIIKSIRKTNRTFFLGMELRNKTQDDRDNFIDLDINHGVVISRIENRRLYNLGIKEGYLVLEINDEKINDVGQIEKIPLRSISSILFLDTNGQKERILFE